MLYRNISCRRGLYENMLYRNMLYRNRKTCCTVEHCTRTGTCCAESNLHGFVIPKKLHREMHSEILYREFDTRKCCTGNSCTGQVCTGRCCTMKCSTKKGEMMHGRRLYDKICTGQAWKHVVHLSLDRKLCEGGCCTRDVAKRKLETIVQ